MDWIQRNPLLAALCLAGAFLVAVIAAEAAFGPNLASLLDANPHRRAVAADAKLLPPPVVVAVDQAYPETAARPLFIPTRRPAPEAPAEAKGSIPKGQYVLVGVIIVGENRTAMLKEKSTGRTVHVERGKELNGIKVAEISPETVTLSLGSDKEVLPLTVQKAGAITPAQAAQQGPFMPSAAEAAAAAAAGQPVAQPVPGQPYANPGITPGSNPNNPAARAKEQAKEQQAVPAAPLSTEELLARRRARRAQGQPSS